MGLCLKIFRKIYNREIPTMGLCHTIFRRIYNLEIPIESSDSKSPSFSELGPILGKPYVDVKSLYNLDKELGRGQFGITYLCTEKATGTKYACKSISHQKLGTQKDIDNVRREVAMCSI
ncbi:hypothetical protein SLA2020_089150 [Shorea laevis]